VPVNGAGPTRDPLKDPQRANWHAMVRPAVRTPRERVREVIKACPTPQRRSDIARAWIGRQHSLSDTAIRNWTPIGRPSMRLRRRLPTPKPSRPSSLARSGPRQTACPHLWPRTAPPDHSTPPHGLHPGLGRLMMPISSHAGDEGESRSRSSAREEADRAMSFGTLLRQERGARGLLLRDMAEMIGVSTSYLSLVELGKCASRGGVRRGVLALWSTGRSRLRRLRGPLRAPSASTAPSGGAAAGAEDRLSALGRAFRRWRVSGSRGPGARVATGRAPSLSFAVRRRLALGASLKRQLSGVGRCRDETCYRSCWPPYSPWLRMPNARRGICKAAGWPWSGSTVWRMEPVRSEDRAIRPLDRELPAPEWHRGERRAGPVLGERGLLRHRRETERAGCLLGPVPSRQARDHRAGLRVRRQAPLRRLVRGRKARVGPPAPHRCYFFSGSLRRCSKMASRSSRLRHGLYGEFCCWNCVLTP
jgi:hypothetical protein